MSRQLNSRPRHWNNNSNSPSHNFSNQNRRNSCPNIAAYNHNNNQVPNAEPLLNRQVVERKSSTQREQSAIMDQKHRGLDWQSDEARISLETTQRKRVSSSHHQSRSVKAEIFSQVRWFYKVRGII